MLLAEMPELGRMTATEAAAMAGLAPMARDSDAMRGKRVISGGEDLSATACFRQDWQLPAITQF
ncbi:hypothetical protein [Acetobacter oeni]|nr:hypothetical protein [Acetobacter oeni]